MTAFGTVEVTSVKDNTDTIRHIHIVKVEPCLSAGSPALGAEAVEGGCPAGIMVFEFLV